MTGEEKFEPMKDPQWVPVITVPTDAQAEQYRELLTDHDLEVLVGLDQWEAHGSAGADDENRKPGVPVLVLDYLLEEARSIIVEREGESVFDLDIEDEEDDEDDLDFELSEDDDEEHLYMDEDDNAADPLDELPEFDAPPIEDEENHHYY